LTHRAMAAHRVDVRPAVVEGDYRPKCSQTGEHEQMGPKASKPRDQLRLSRDFFTALSHSVDENLDETSPNDSFQLNRGEGLSAVALTKRFAAELFYGS